MTFGPQFLEEIRTRVPLAGVIGRRVKLIRRGREQVGLCPFHNERSPSFTVSEDKGFFHCFGCGAHGDVIGFVMRSESLPFPEAVERLAGEAGLDIPVTSPEERQNAAERSSLHAIMEAACAWFEHQLRSPAGRPALEYLKSRGLDDDTVARFRLGFAPGGRGALRDALAAAGRDEADMVAAGLLVRPDDGRAPYDRFRGRVMFPITDRRGRVIAFGGRLLGGDGPKYLNSPETALFHKGRVLYGLAQASPAARETGELVVTEGYMDVIALHRSGLKTAVAPLGTALTEAQMELLWRIVPEPVLCFDGDAAGRRAAFRAVERALPALGPGRSLRFAILPEGEDPDSLIAAGGAAAVSAVLEAARPLGDMLWESEVAGRKADTPERRAEIRRDLLQRVYSIADRTVQQYYRDDIEVRLEAIFRPRRGAGAARRGLARAGDERPAGLHADGNLAMLDLRIREGFLAAIIRHPELMDEVGEELGSHGLGDGGLDGLRQEIVRIADFGLDSAGLKSHLEGHGFSGLLTRVLSREVYEAAPFARPDKSQDETLRQWRDVWAHYWLRKSRIELDQDMAALGDDMTTERWERLAAKRKHLQAFEQAAAERAAEMTDEAEVR